MQKLEREVQGHQGMVDKTLAAGRALVDQRHFASASVKDKCHELLACWNLLGSECAKRRKKLELQLKAQTVGHPKLGVTLGDAALDGVFLGSDAIYSFCGV